MDSPDVSSEAVSLQETCLIVVIASDEISLDTWHQTRIRVPQAVHADNQPGILDVGLEQSGVRRQSD